MLSHTLNSVDMDANKNRSKFDKGGDANPEYRDRKVKRLRLEDVEKQAEEMGHFGGGEDAAAATSAETPAAVEPKPLTREEKRAAKRAENARARLPKNENASKHATILSTL